MNIAMDKKKSGKRSHGNTNAKACASCRRYIMDLQIPAADIQTEILLHAARVGHHMCIENLVRSGVDVNAKLSGRSALMTAIHANSRDCVNVLIDAGADVNETGFSGDTPLIAAALLGNDDYVKLLLRKGAHVNYTGRKDGITALYMTLVQFNQERTRRAVDHDIMKGGSEFLNRALGGNFNESETEELRMSVKHSPIRKANYLECLKALLKAGADVNIQDNITGITALSYAVCDGTTEFVTALLKAGADVNIKDPADGSTILIRAVGKGRSDIVKALLGAGADVNMKADQGITALMVAAAVGDYKDVKILLNAGADVNITGVDGSTALTCANVQGHSEVVKILLEAGADAKPCGNSIPRCTSSLEPYLRALLRGDENAISLEEATVRWVCEKVKQSESDAKVAPSGFFLLHRHIEANNVDTVSMLIVARSDLNIINPAGNTPLITAVMNNPDDRCLRILLDKGADVNKADSRGATPLMCAVEENKINFVKILIDKGANVNQAHNQNGATPLITAAKNGNTECVKVLLAARADVEKADKEGMTPFFASLFSSWNSECRRALLKAGANVNCKTKNGDFPLMVAIGDTELLQFLLSNGADVNMKNDRGVNALIVAASKGRNEDITLLLQKGADVNSKDENGNTALLVAVYSFNEDKWYRRYQITLPGETSGYNTPLGRRLGETETEEDKMQRMKAFGNYFECGKTLLDAGANVNIMNKTYMTVLSYAACEGIGELVTALLKVGADVNITDPDGSSALTHATAQGHSNIVKVLLNAGAVVNIDTATAAIYCRDQTIFQLIYKARYGKNCTEDVI